MEFIQEMMQCLPIYIDITLLIYVVSRQRCRPKDTALRMAKILHKLNIGFL